MEKVRLGIIGIGNMGTGHLSNIEIHKRCPEITVTAVADIKPERLQWVKENIGDHVALFHGEVDIAQYLVIVAQV